MLLQVSREVHRDQLLLIFHILGTWTIFDISAIDFFDLDEQPLRERFKDSPTSNEQKRREPAKEDVMRKFTMSKDVFVRKCTLQLSWYTSKYILHFCMCMCTVLYQMCIGDSGDVCRVLCPIASGAQPCKVLAEFPVFKPSRTRQSVEIKLQSRCPKSVVLISCSWLA